MKDPEITVDKHTFSETENKSENAWLQEVLYYAKLHDWLAYHTHDSRRSAAGFPDLVLVRGDTVLFLELKTNSPRSKLTEGQKTWLDALRQVKNIGVHVVRPRGWAQLWETLQ